MGIQAQRRVKKWMQEEALWGFNVGSRAFAYIIRRGRRASAHHRLLQQQSLRRSLFKGAWRDGWE
jgi:hypothetical protein